jgi:transcriptional regulator with XRE-family HTH domain
MADRFLKETMGTVRERKREEVVATSLQLLARRLRQARQEAGISLRELAKRAGVAASTIQKIERGRLVPSVAVTVRLAEALGRRPSYFIDGHMADDVEVRLVPKGQGRVVASPGSPIFFERIAEPLAEPQMEAFRVVVQPGGHSGAETAIAYRGEEVVVCLRGRLLFEVAGQSYLLGPGDTLHFKGHLPHTWRNPGPEEAEMLMVCAFLSAGR